MNSPPSSPKFLKTATATPSLPRYGLFYGDIGRALTWTRSPPVCSIEPAYRHPDGCSTSIRKLMTPN